MCLLIALNLNIKADDAVMYSNGNTIFPIQETSIELKKETLILNKVQKDQMSVIVDFEFFNPGEDIELLVGFVTPPADRAVHTIGTEHPHISNFNVFVNNELIDYKFNSLGETGYQELIDNAKGDDFVYYFTVNFKKGTNYIKHSYTYRGGWSASPTSPGPNFYYRLTTGKLWANFQITEFKLLINMGEDVYFKVPFDFGDSNISLKNWDVLGIGKIIEGKHIYTKKKELNVKIKSGFLCFSSTNFKPNIDLSILTYNPESDLGDLFPYLYPRWYGKNKDLTILSDEQLRLLRNSLFALHDYKFKSKDLNDYFNKHAWYIPDPSIKNNVELLTSEQQEIFSRIIQEQNRRNK